VVCISGNVRDCGLPRVMVDQHAVGRLAAEHLLNLGLRRLAFYGLHGPWYSRERYGGFLERSREAGVPCEVLETPPNLSHRATLQQRRDPVNRWLKTLQLPVGILAVHDYRARVLADQCMLLGLRVPHDVAILGVDNDLTACEFSNLSLSSVSTSAWQIGIEAAKLLDGLMDGRPRRTGTSSFLPTAWCEDDRPTQSLWTIRMSALPCSTCEITWASRSASVRL